MWSSQPGCLPKAATWTLTVRPSLRVLGITREVPSLPNSSGRLRYCQLRCTRRHLLRLRPGALSLAFQYRERDRVQELQVQPEALVILGDGPHLPFVFGTLPVARVAQEQPQDAPVPGEHDLRLRRQNRTPGRHLTDIE